MFETDSEETYSFDETDESKSHLCCLKKKSFSVQSGDIQRITPLEETDDVRDVNTLGLKEKLIHQLQKTFYKVVNVFFSNFVLPVLTLLVVLVVVPLVLILLAIFVYPPQLDLSLRSFQIPNHESSLNYDALQMALKPHVTSSDDGKHKRDVGPPACTERQIRRKSWMLDLFFVSKDGGNILTENRIKQIHKIEQDVVKHKYGDLGYEDFCHKSKPYERCDPLNSLLTYFYPSYDGTKWLYDGNGDQMRPINSTLAEAFQVDSSYWYGEFNTDKSESKFLRSQLRIGVPILNYCHYFDNVEPIHKWVAGYFISFIPYLDSASTE